MNRVTIAGLRGVVVSVLVAGAISAIHAKGPDPAETGSAYTELGYNRDSVYASIDGNEINAFNFNFLFDIPFNLGLSYPENAGVSLQATLTFNSRISRWQSRGKRKFLRIRRQNPFGPGFDFHLGRIIATLGPVSDSPWTYVDGSGAQHRLFPFASSTTEFRTHDGSHLRAVLSADDTWTVSFPSGLVQRLGNRISGTPLADLTDAHTGCNPAAPEPGELCPTPVFVPDAQLSWPGYDRDYVGWHVKSVYTRASTNAPTVPSYSVIYYGEQDSETAFRHVIKSITDQFGRTIQFHLDTTRGVVDWVSAPAPSKDGVSRVATYLLDYQLESFSTQDASWSAWVLKRLSGPDVAEAGASQRYVHEFTYTGGGTGGGPILQSIRYPSGRLTVLSYATYPFLNGGPGPCQGNTNPLEANCYGDSNGGTCAFTHGVSRIDTFLDGDPLHGASNQQTTKFSQSTIWRDDHQAEGCGSEQMYPRYDQLHTMIDPAGNKTVFRFRSPKEPDEAKLHGLLVSETYYGGGDTGTSPTAIKQVNYAYSYQNCPDSCNYFLELDTSGGLNADYEMVSDKIVTKWLDDENEFGNPLTHLTYQIEERSHFDKFGHYQRSIVYGTAVGDESKITIKDYANDNSPQSMTGSGCSNLNGIRDNWLGDVVSREEVRKKFVGVETILTRSDYGFDLARGVRTSEVHRTNVGASVDYCTNAPTASNGDKVVEYGFTADGDLSSERHYVPGLASTSTPGDVTARFTYKYGARESGKNDAFVYYNYVRVIDHDSGLPLAQRSAPSSLTDQTAVTTTFAYDVLGRMTNIAHGTDWPIVVAYENAASAYLPAPAFALARVRSTQGTGTAQTEAVDHFQFGRFEHSEKLNPDGSRAYRYVQYNGAGRVAFESEWTRNTSIAGVPGTATEYAVYDASGTKLYEDPFGRPTKITDALGKISTVRYFGLNKETIVRGVALKATALHDPADVKTQYFTDSLGRLRIVSAPTVVNPGSGPYEATGAGGVYTYDVLGRLTTAAIAAKESISIQPSESDRYNASASDAQTRTSAYDTLGRLTSSTTPEQGTVTSLAWNALGQVTESQDALGEDWGHKHRSTYDGAGRPTQTERIVPTAASTLSPTFSTLGGWRYDAVGTCLQQPAGTPHTGWYVGGTNCTYASTGTINLDSSSIGVSDGSILAFKYFREVRADSAGGSRDRFRVLVQDQANTSGPWVEIYFQDSSQISWSRWMWAPALSLQDWSGKNIKVRFEFDSVDQNANTMLKGIGISQVEVRRPSSVILTKSFYDEPRGVTGNKPLGKPTRMIEYDEATGAAIFSREMHYADANGRLSDEKLTLDWDRDGSDAVFVDSYQYDLRGDLSAQRRPHPQGTPSRLYSYERHHGAIVSVTAVDDVTQALQNFVPMGVAPGIEYNDAGGMSVVRYGNYVQQSIQANDAFLPSQFSVHAPGGAVLWDTGQYDYDGAHNIKQIGTDYYRYDAAMRLTWARINTNLQGIVDLDQSYDAFGNMTSQTAVQTGSYTSSLPQGMHFTGRTYVTGNQNKNRITNSGFVYDLNGNLTSEPGHDTLPAQRYAFSPETQLTLITPGVADSHPGTPYQAALYEGGDHRWFRSNWAEGSKAVITLRDASGKVVADYVESTANLGLELQKEYVYANDQLVAINSACGPRATLALSTPATIGTTVWFDKSHPSDGAATYTMFIRTNDGQSKSISGLALSNHFSRPQSDFFPNVTNYISIEADLACGATGYSNAVSYAYSPASTSCIKSSAAYRLTFTTTGSGVKAEGLAECAPQTTYNVYYRDPNAEEQYLGPLNAQPTTTPSKQLSNIPYGSGEGYYFITPISPVTHQELVPSPVVWLDSASSGGGTAGAAAGAATGMNVQYVHWDHLGSTRLATDEMGVPISRLKYYPFGMEAESFNGDNQRQKFTGHERDDRVGLDYMMARSSRTTLARFLQPDGYTGSARPALPQSWNRYAYVLNNPINAADPTGYLERVVQSSHQTNAFGNRGETNDGDTPADQPDNDQGLLGATPEEVEQGLGMVMSLTLGAVMPGLPSMDDVISPGGSGVTTSSKAASTAGKTGATLADDLAAAATRAQASVGPGSGGKHGTLVHTLFEKLVNALGLENVSTEVSYLNGAVVRRGTAGSVRLDVVSGPTTAPKAVFDLKTGAAMLTPARVRDIQSHIPGGGSVPVYCVRP